MNEADSLIAAVTLKKMNALFIMNSLMFKFINLHFLLTMSII